MVFLYNDINFTINKGKFIIFGPSTYFTFLNFKISFENGFEVYLLINSNSISYTLI